jgi:hypothetical protein
MDVILYLHPSPSICSRWIPEGKIRAQIQISSQIITCAMQMMLHSKLYHGAYVTEDMYNSPFVWWAQSHDVMLWLLEYNAVLQEEYNRLYHSRLNSHILAVECMPWLSHLTKDPFTPPSKEWLPYDCILDTDIDSYRCYTIKLYRKLYRRASRKPFWFSLY